MAQRSTPELSSLVRDRLERVLERFEDAWRAGQQPRLEDYLDGTGEQRQALLIELVHADLHYRLGRGEAVRVDAYLIRHAELQENPAVALDLIEAEYRLRLRTEPGLGVDEYLQRFPRWQDALAARIPPPARAETIGGCSAAGLETPALSSTVQLPALPGAARFTETRAGAVRMGRYEIEGEIARGGMGVVYRARDTLLNRTVALKVIHPEKTSPALQERFEAEARAVARLDHSHIVKVFDVGEWPSGVGGQATPFLALEYVAGGSLGRRLGKDTLPPAEAARLVRLLARAMQHAHERKIIHRDLKPDNVLLAEQGDEPALNTVLGCPKVTDFGLARAVEQERRLTQTGTVAGTPAWMAPEQVEGLPDVGPAADVWALGAILYRLLAGQPPFESASLVDLLFQICKDPPPPLRQKRPEIPEELERICLLCLEKAPERRPTAGDLARRLDDFLTRAADLPGKVGSPAAAPTVSLAAPLAPHGRRGRRWLAASGAVLALVLAVGLVLWANRPKPDSDSGGSGSEAAMQPAPLWVKTFRVEQFVVEGKETHPAGAVSRDAVPEDEKPLSALPFGARVWVIAEFAEPAYAYLIAFNANGEEQLLWPVNASKKADDTVAPSRVARVKYPDRKGPKGGDVLFELDDEPRGGLQAFAVVLSRKPLPAFATWKKARGAAPWSRLAGWRNLYLADGEGVYSVVPGRGVARGSEREAGEMPDLVPLCRALRRGAEVDWVEVLAVPVAAKGRNP